MGLPGLALLTPCASRENRRLGFCFVQFREYFQNNFSETKNSRKQELALWHLVNRLVPEKLFGQYSRNSTKQKPNLLFFRGIHGARWASQGEAHGLHLIGSRGQERECAGR